MVTKLNKSPDRFSFQRDSYLERKAIEGKTEENNENVKAMMEYFDNVSLEKQLREDNPEWRENNMEYDLRSTRWICDKVKDSDVYAQHLYAAMCNNEFQKNDMMPILKDQRWGCSWRYAGGIVADMQEKGDYIDWYCSGIRSADDLSPEEFNNLTEDQQIHYKECQAYVGESVVTDEIRADLKKLGWITIDEDNNQD